MTGMLLATAPIAGATPAGDESSATSTTSGSRDSDAGTPSATPAQATASGSTETSVEAEEPREVPNEETDEQPKGRPADDGTTVDAQPSAVDDTPPVETKRVTNADNLSEDAVEDAADVVVGGAAEDSADEALEEPQPTAAAGEHVAEAATEFGPGRAPTHARTDAAPRTSADLASVPVAGTQVLIPATRPSMLNVVGSVLLNVLVGLIHIVDGPPVLPANSTVTVRTSSLNLSIGSGRSVQADWYFPQDADESTRLVYLQHGFLASGPMYSYTAARMAERTNSIVVMPSLSSNFFAADAAWVGGSTMHRAVAELFVGERRQLVESASAAAGYAVTLPDRFVLVGHSAGGTLVTSAAGFMADNGAIDHLVGVVLLDGVEPAGSRLLSDAMGKLRDANDRPVYLISSDRYFWSRGGDMADKIQLARPGRFNGVGLTGGLHIDYMEGGNPIVQFGEYLTAGFSLRRNIDAAAQISVGWVNDLFDGTTSQGVYGPPGQSIPVVTPAGTATAVVLPLGRPVRPVWPPLLDAALAAIFDFGGRYLFVYEPLRGVETAVIGAGAPLPTG